MKKRILWRFQLVVIVITALFAITIFADEAMMYRINVEDFGQHVSKTNALEKKPFDAKKYEIAYSAFIYSGNPKDAQLIAESAYKQTHLIQWQERYAESSLWSGKVYLALDLYSDLVFQQKQKQYLDKTIKLAEAIRADYYLVSLYQSKLDSEPNNVAIIVGLAKAYYGIGDPNQAILLYNKAYQLDPKATYLESIYDIQFQNGNFKEAENVLSDIEKKYGTTLKTVLAHADLSYREMNFKAALNHLNSIPNQNGITDISYWQSVASLSWFLGDFNSAKNAYYHLYALNQINYSQLINYLKLFPTNSEEQMRLALDGWRRFHQIDLYLMVLNQAIQKQSWPLLIKMYSFPLSRADRQALEKEPDYWQGFALLIEHQGDPQLARRVLLDALVQRPNNEILQLTYLNFLLTQLSIVLPQQEPVYLKKGLQYYVNKWDKNYDFRGLYAYALSLFDYLRESLHIFQVTPADPNNLHDWYYRYSYALDDLYFHKSAYDMRKATWESIQLLVKDQTKDSYDFWVTYNGISAKFAPAQINYPLSLYMAEHFQYLASPDGIFTWAIDNDSYDLMAYLNSYYYPRGLSTWAALRLAILQNDQVKINQIISTMPPAVPRKDLVTGARQINALPYAQTFAFENVGRSSDYERYDQLTEVMLLTSNQLIAASEYEIYGELQGPRQRFAGIFFIDYKWSLKPYASIWQGKTNNNESLASRNYLENIFGLALQRQTNRSHFYIDAGQRQALFSSFFARIGGDYIVSSKLTLGGWLGYNQRNNINTYSLIAGSDDEAVLTATYQLTPRDEFAGAVSLYNFYLQDRTPLGSGQSYFGAYHHKFWLSYPDYFVGLLGNYNRYQVRDKDLTGRVQTMFPDPTQPVPASTFLSDNYWQVGVEVGFGNDIRDNYTHDWRPYAVAGFTYDSISGKGYYLDTGLAGMVFGRDKLMFYYVYSTNTQGQATKNYLLGMQYQIYF